MPHQLASLSLDLDNKWSYLKTRGDPGWDECPTYLPSVIPHIHALLAAQQTPLTVFVVGKDAADPANRAALQSLAEAATDVEIANHSYRHEPWLHLYSQAELREELERAESAIVAATGCMPCGFRGPGYSTTPTVLELLAERGYAYDASPLPTFIGPVARAYYFFRADLTDQQQKQRDRLFGGWRDGLQSLRARIVPTSGRSLVQIPVSTMPLFRTPIHLSYLLYLAGYSELAARLYFRMALRLLSLRGVEPSLLLHPLDFLGCDDDQDLSFFPGMHLPGQTKRRLTAWAVGELQRRFQVVTLRTHADAVRAREATSAADVASSIPERLPAVRTAESPATVSGGDLEGS